MSHRFLTGAAAVALAVGLAAAGPAHAQAPAAPAPSDQTPAAAPPAHPTVDTPIGQIMFSSHIEAGVNGNIDDPKNNTNFGQLFTDRSNSFRVNQAWAQVEKDLDPAATGLDWGFKFAAFYGTDARITHFFTVWDQATNSPYQWDIVEANGQAHLPVIFSGGIDLKAGMYSTPLGYEVIDSTGNFFYTHSYIFNYGLPLKHTGLLSTSHINDMFDLWLGVDTGNQAWIPTRAGDNNGSAAGLFGLGINNPIPNLTILALAHLGPENGYVKDAKSCTNGSTVCYFNGAGPVTGTGQRQDPNNHARQIYDVVTTYKVNDALTVANEVNFIKDDLGVTNCLANGLPRSACHSGATAEGVALYGIYQFNDQLSFGARGEIFRDDQGFFVASATSGTGFVDAERGIPTTGVYGVGKATYSELTLGVNYKPPLPALPLNTGLTIRPELRWDHAWGMVPGAHAFDANATSPGTKDDQILISVDAIIAF